jgi:hypothetical protein
LDNGCVDTVVRDNDISAVCLGITAGLTVYRLAVTGNNVHDVPGQHGLYLQNGTTVTINNNTVRNAYYNGIKVQLSVASTADSVGTVISGNNIDACGDTGIVLINTATDLSTAKKFRAVTVADNTASNCLRAYYFASVQGGVFSNLAAYNSTTDAFTVLDCKNILSSNWLVDTCGRVGVRMTTATGSVMDRISFRGLRIHNPAGANLANNIYGVYLLQGSNVDLDGLVVTATNGFMDYGLFLASATAGDQQTFALRNADLSGSLAQGARFQSAITNVKDWTNNRIAGGVLNKPNGVSAVVTVP